ncbi:MAG: hypothetical protein ACD_35C00266G0001 [uncultured bacterium]|nr:MAG: hypothetical protein ACD_35C00266G0001 [uncultured bacterium]
MKNETGMWVDHQKAVIVTLVDKKETVQIILSNMDNSSRYSIDAPKVSMNTLSKSDTTVAQDQALELSLNKFYSEIAYKIRETDSILIFGPGNAKVELAALLKSEKLGSKITAVDTVDKMTDRQISEKVQDFFIHA